MAKVIAVSNHKGGVGKTTSVINIGAGLNKKDKKVLLVDLDPQANLSQSLNIEDPEFHVYGAIKGNYPLKPIEILKGLHIIPSVSELSSAEPELTSEAGREFILSELLEPVVNNYDYILIDCPPSLGLFTINAFTAADEIFIPMQAQYLALQGIGKLLALKDVIKKRLNSDLEIGGIFITQFDRRKILNRYVLETIESHFDDKVFNSYIRNNVALAEAPNEGLDIFRYQGNSIGAFDYMKLTNEILKKQSPGKKDTTT